MRGLQDERRGTLQRAPTLYTPPEKTAYIGIGSNQGDRLDFCRQAIFLISSPDTLITQVSSLYETEPVEYTDQAHFYNAVAEVITRKDPRDLLEGCQAIERKLGKKITIPKGPRTIDLDLLFYQDRVISDSKMTIPHPSALTRLFVMIPMAEIAPDFVPPQGPDSAARSIREFLDTLPMDRSVQKLYGPEWAERLTLSRQPCG